MDDKARRVYRGFAILFLTVGGIFLLLGAVRAFLAPDVLDANPVPISLLLITIGVLLAWTARDRGED